MSDAIIVINAGSTSVKFAGCLVGAQHTLELHVR
jgi:hypothetical protein